MLRCARPLLVQSHQLKKSQHPDAGTRFGRHYNRSFIKYGFSGFGISTYTTKKNRTFKIRPTNAATAFGSMAVRDHVGAPLKVVPSRAATRDHMSNTTKSLSPHWRSFGLSDGGVLFVHPSHNQVMAWNQATLKKEAEATGLTSMDQWVNSRMQAIIAENTLESVTLSHWRKRHIWAMLKKQGGLYKRTSPMSNVEKGVFATLRGRQPEV